MQKQQKLRFIVKKVWPGSELEIGDILETYNSNGYVCNRTNKTFFFSPEVYFEFFENGDHECIFNPKTNEYISIGDIINNEQQVIRIYFSPSFNEWRIETPKAYYHLSEVIKYEKTYYVVENNKNLWTITSVPSKLEWIYGNFKNFSLHTTRENAEECVNMNSRLFSMGDINGILIRGDIKDNEFKFALWLKGKFEEEWYKRKPYKH